MQIACPLGYFSAAGSSSCTYCPPGFACAHGSINPTPCAVGRYSPGGLIAAGCLPCASGYDCPTQTTDYAPLPNALVPPNYFHRGLLPISVARCAPGSYSVGAAATDEVCDSASFAAADICPQVVCIAGGCLLSMPAWILLPGTRKCGRDHHLPCWVVLPGQE